MKLSITTISFFLLSLTTCKRDQHTTVDKYFLYLNNYQGDSLQLLLAEDFKVKLTYADYSYNRDDFFDRYLRNCKVYNEKSKILKIISDIEPKQFLVEDNSDYLKYLKVNSPTWIVTIKSENRKILEVIIDTTETSRAYFKDIKEKSDHFTTWLVNKYPDETSATLHETDGLFLKRLKEYVEIQ